MFHQVNFDHSLSQRLKVSTIGPLSEDNGWATEGLTKVIGRYEEQVKAIKTICRSVDTTGSPTNGHTGTPSSKAKKSGNSGKLIMTNVDFAAATIPSSSRLCKLGESARGDRASRTQCSISTDPRVKLDLTPYLAEECMSCCTIPDQSKLHHSRIGSALSQSFVSSAPHSDIDC